MFAEQMLRMVAALLVGIWVARYLGPAQFGLYSYSIAFVALFNFIANLGLDNIVVRDLVRNPELKNIYLGTAFWLKLFGAIAMLTVIAVTVVLTSNDTTTNVYIFIIATGSIFQSFDVITFYFQAQVQLKFVSICKITQLFFSSILKIILVLTHAELFWFVFVSLVDQLTLGVALFFTYRSRSIDSFYVNFDRAIALRFLRDSLPLMLGGMVMTIYMRIDQVMIKEMLGQKEVGLYSAAVRLCEVWYFVPMIITNSLFPAITNAKKASEELYYSRLQRLYTFLVWASIAIALPMTFLSRDFVVVLYGDAYRDAGQVLMIYIWAGVFVSLGTASGAWLANENLQRYAFYRTLSGVIVNILFNYVLIPKYGMVGSAIATVLAQVMAALLFDCFSKRTRIMFFTKLRALSLAGAFKTIGNKNEI